MGLVDSVVCYAFVCAAALGAARRAKWITVHTENVKHPQAKMAFEKFVWLGDVVAEKSGKLINGAKEALAK
eukprot:CAMPEP_0114263666 /NCGR_PEP_ID=MMETSP0058-20121206/22674_1 /TAXON_ID=36894 /ORGANISM="Pyramimonas parkeae, CCMP726" /LENGTH=70 /DNA_ID=CAMNT_0001380047 /DNA_START=44 /DNA_END=253 /DNA_ORIENTATION=+